MHPRQLLPKRFPPRAAAADWKSSSPRSAITSGLTILELGGATQKNISFITDLGHRLYSEDFLRSLNEAFDGEDTAEQTNPGRIEYFLKQTLDYPEGHFDGVLVWDVLEYLNPVLLNAVVERLAPHRAAEEPTCWRSSIPTIRWKRFPPTRSASTSLDSLEISQQGMRRPAQLYNNRSLEKLFGRFESVKFFLTRERLREVIIKV